MGSLGFWIFYCVCFGLIGGALFTYMSKKREGRLMRFIKSTIIYTLFALAFVYILFRVA